MTRIYHLRPLPRATLGLGAWPSSWLPAIRYADQKLRLPRDWKRFEPARPRDRVEVVR